MAKWFSKKIFQQTQTNIAGLLICLILFGIGFIIHGGTRLYLNLSGFLIVAAGTAGATLLSYKTERLVILYKVLHASYTKELIAPETLINTLVRLSVKRRIHGVLPLQKDENRTQLPFLRKAIGLMVDGHTPSQITKALNTEMFYFKMRREQTETVLRTMADVAPSFGLVGSVVGLISMLTGVSDPDVILSAIPIALTSTLYGIVLSNFFFLPFAANIKERTLQELLLQKIIAEAIAGIAEDIHPRILDRDLKSYLTPSARADDLIPIRTLPEEVDMIDQDSPLENIPAPAASQLREEESC